MPEHYTKRTVSASVWCSKCGGVTQHLVQGGRRGACMQCLAELDAEHARRAPIAPAAEQFTLFRKPG
jgi:hypothetical protein